MTTTRRNFLIASGLLLYLAGLFFLPAPLNSFVLLIGVTGSIVRGLSQILQANVSDESQRWFQRFRAALTPLMLRRFSQGCLLVSVLLLMRMMWLIHYDSVYSQARTIFLILPFAIVLLYPALRSYGILTYQPETAPNYNKTLRLPRFDLVAMATILLCLLILSNVLPIGIQSPPFLSQHLQVLLFIGGLILLATGLSGVYRRDMSDVFAKRPNIWLVLMMLLAFAVRVRELEFGIHRLVDEYHFMQAVGDLWQKGGERMLLPHGGITAFTWLYPYVQWHASMLISPSLTGLRITSVIIGTLQIPVLYLLARELFNKRLAFSAAVMLAALPLHVQFSRIGLNNIADPLIGMLALFFLIRGMKRGGQHYFVLAGLFLGLTHYFYEGGRLFYTAFIILWLIWLRLFKRRDDGYRLPDKWQLLIFGGTFALTIMPLYLSWWMNLLPLTPRLRSAGGAGASHILSKIFGSPAPLAELGRMLEPHFLMYPYTTTINDFFTGERMLPWLAAALLLTGIAFSVYRLRRPAFALVFWWLIGVPVGLALTIDAKPDVPRYVVALPALAMMLAIGLDEGIKLLRAIFPHTILTTPVWRKRFTGAIVFGITVTAIWQYHGIFLPDYYQRGFYQEYVNGEFARDVEDALFRAMQLPGGSDVYIISDTIQNATSLGAIHAYYGRVGEEQLRLNVILNDELYPGIRNSITNNSETRHHYFFIDTDNYTLLAQLREILPGLQGAVMSPYDVPSEKQYALYYHITDIPTFEDAMPVPDNSFILIIGFSVLSIWGLSRVLRQDTLSSLRRNTFSMSARLTPQVQRLFAQFCLLLFIAVLMRMTWLVDHKQFYSTASTIFGWLPIAILLLYPALRVYRHLQDDDATSTQINDTAAKLRYLPLSGGIFMLILLTLANMSSLDAPPFLSQHLQVLLFIGGLTAIAIGFSGASIREITHTVGQKINIPVLLITLLAFAVRVRELEFGIHRLVDEVHFMEAVAGLWYGDEQRLLLPHGWIAAFTWLFPYGQWHTSLIFGASLSGLRLFAVFVGLLQIPVIYLLARELLNRRVALLAAFMLALLPLHIQFSRIGLNNIADPLIGMLALFFLIRGMKRGGQHYFVLAGLFLGLTHYFYEGGRLFFTLFVVLWLFWLRFVKPRADGYQVPALRSILLSGTVFTLTIMPLYFSWWRHGYAFIPRLQSAGEGVFATNISLIFGTPTPFYNTGQLLAPYFLRLVYGTDRSDYFAGGSLLPALAVFFFFIGIVFCVYRLRRPAGSLLIWWLIGVPVGIMLAIADDTGIPQQNILEFGLYVTPGVARYVLLTPVLAILVAIGIDKALWLIRATFPKAVFTAQHWQTGMTGIVGLIVGGAGLWHFHGEFLPEFYNRAFYSEVVDGKLARDTEDALFRAMQMPAGSDVYFISPIIRNGTFGSVFHHYYGRSGDNDLILHFIERSQLKNEQVQAIADSSQEGRPQYFFIDTDNYTLLAQLREILPDLQGAVMSPYNIPSEKQYALYYYP